MHKRSKYWYLKDSWHFRYVMRARQNLLRGTNDPQSIPYMCYPESVDYFTDLAWIMTGHILFTILFFGLTALFGFLIIVKPLIPGLNSEENAVFGFFAGIYLWCFGVVLYYLFIISLISLEKLLGKEVYPIEVRIPTLMDLLIFV